MKRSTILASVLSIPLIALAAALPALPAVAAPLDEGAEVIMAHVVNDLGGTFDVVALEAPSGQMPHGTFSYVGAAGFAYGGTLDAIHVEEGRAYMTGVITYSTGPPIGTGIGFWVDDNGTPGSGAQDVHSYFWFTQTLIPGLANIEGYRNFLDSFEEIGRTTGVISGNILVQG